MIRVHLGHSSVTVTQRHMHVSPHALAVQVVDVFNSAPAETPLPPTALSTNDDMTKDEATSVSGGEVQVHD